MSLLLFYIEYLDKNSINDINLPDQLSEAVNISKMVKNDGFLIDRNPEPTFIFIWIRIRLFD